MNMIMMMKKEKMMKPRQNQIVEAQDWVALMSQPC